LLSVVLLLVFRQPLVMLLVNQYLRDHNTRIDCLEFVITWPLGLDVERICVRSPDFDFNAKHMLWSGKTNRLDVASATLIHKSTPPQNASNHIGSTFPLLPLSPPALLPWFNIKRLELRSELFRRPVVLAIKRTGIEQFEIAGDWQAKLHLADKEITGETNWTLAQVQSLVTHLDSLSLSSELLHRPIQTRLSFDGERVHSQTNLEVYPGTNLDVVLSAFPFRSDVTADYQLSFSGPARMAFSSSGHISMDKNDRICIDAPRNIVTVPEYRYEGFRVVDIYGEFSAHYVDIDRLQAVGIAKWKELQGQGLSVNSVQAKFELAGKLQDSVAGKFDTKISSVHTNQLVLLGLKNYFDFTFSKKKQLVAEGKSDINAVWINGYPIGRMGIEHNLNVSNREPVTEHELTLDKGLVVQIKTYDKKAQVRINRQPLTRLGSSLDMLLPGLSINGGHVSAFSKFNFSQATARGTLKFHDVSANYQDYRISKLRFEPKFTVGVNGFQVSPSKLTIESFYAGVPVENIVAIVNATDGKLRAEQISAHVLGGQFKLNGLWLDERSQQALLRLQDINMAELITLERQSGIDISGRLAGDLPLHLQKGQISIRGGVVTNQDVGRLEISHNPAFEALKSQQKELGQVLVLLQSLDFNTLSGKVNLQPDGWLFLKIAIIGFNPVQQQEVNFNYSHQENIFTLLKALRLTEKVQKQVEQGISEN